MKLTWLFFSSICSAQPVAATEMDVKSRVFFIFNENVTSINLLLVWHEHNKTENSPPTAIGFSAINFHADRAAQLFGFASD
jgi:hypothetical protein